MTNWLAIDFGTSNSAAAHFKDGDVARIHLENDEATIPTSIFFSFEDRKVVYGHDANRRLIEGEDGRYMRSLKSVLGTSLMDEEQMLLGKRINFHTIITNFISHIKTQSELRTGLKFANVVAGRPVFFHSEDPQRNARAREDLEACFKRAGFHNVIFMLEPEAATLSSRNDFAEGALGLVIDIGGGTSDFTVFRKQGEKNVVLGSHGCRLGGTDFDRSINYDFFMPELGRGHDLNLTIGAGVAPAPNQIFAGLSRWERIPFIYTPFNTKLARQLVREAVDPKPFENLQRVLQHRLGHDIAFRAEQAKIDNNQADTDLLVDLSFITKGLQKPISAQNLRAALNQHEDTLVREIMVALDSAGQRAPDIDHAVLVGGSSLMYLVHNAMRRTLTNAQPTTGAAFTAIVDGLALRCGELQNAV